MAEKPIFSHDPNLQTTILEALRRISAGLVTNPDLQQNLKTILEEISKILPQIQECDVFLYESGRLNLAVAVQTGEQDHQPAAGLRHGGLIYSVARLGKLISVPDMSAHPFYVDASQQGSIAGFPLKMGTRVVGVLIVSRLLAGDFSEDEINLIKVFANQATVTIENARLQNQIEQQALLDPLTGLHNRRSLEVRLEEEFARNEITETQGELATPSHPFSLLMMDLDGFKKLNDTYGRLAGDQILKEITSAINQALRKTDFLARYGGDEIALVLSDANRESAQNVANRIQEFVSKTRFNLPGIPQHSLAVSIGVAIYPENGSSTEELLSAVEQALLLAKRDPHNKISYASEASAGSP